MRCVEKKKKPPKATANPPPAVSAVPISGPIDEPIPDPLPPALAALVDAEQKRPSNDRLRFKLGAMDGIGAANRGGKSRCDKLQGFAYSEGYRRAFESVNATGERPSIGVLWNAYCVDFGADPTTGN